MKVFREVRLNVNHIEVGDRIKVEFEKEDEFEEEEKYTATAIREDEDGVLFLFDDCLNKAYPMNEYGGTGGGYLESDLRKYLAEVVEKLPYKLRRRLVEDENGDRMWLLSLEEVFGFDSNHDNTENERIEWMKNKRHRIVNRGGKYEWWWLNNVISAKYFAFVSADGHCGAASTGVPSSLLGVRPAFKIKNL